MRNDKLLKNKAVIKALSIGLAAMMAITPVVGTVDVYAGDGDPGNDDPSEIKSEAKVELKGTSTTSVDGEQSDSHEVSGSADVSLDVSGNISVEAEVEHNDVDIDNTQQADASIVPNADGTVTETDTAVSTGTEETEIGNTTTKTDTRVETKVETTTASDINDYENLSTTQTEGSVEVKTIVTSVTVTITTTETTISTTYDEEVTDADTIAAIEAAIADPAEGQIRTDETGNYITVNGQEYKYTQTPITTQAPVEDAAVLEKINEELLKEDKNVTTKDGKNYVEVEGIWYEYETGNVDATTEEGAKTMSQIRTAAENVKPDENGVKEVVIGDKLYSYVATPSSVEIADLDLLAEIEAVAKDVEPNADGTKKVTLNGKEYTYTAKTGSVSISSDLFKQIEDAAKDAELNADGTKDVLVDNVWYKYTPANTEPVLLDAEKDAATIASIKSAIEKAKNDNVDVETIDIDGITYECIEIGGVKYGFNSKAESSLVTDKELLAQIREEAKNVSYNADGTKTVIINGVTYTYTPARQDAVSEEVTFLKSLDGYNMISTENMTLGTHINGGIIVCGTLGGSIGIDNNRDQNNKEEGGTVTKINKLDENASGGVRVINTQDERNEKGELVQQGTGGRVGITKNKKEGQGNTVVIENDNGQDKTYFGNLVDITQKTADEIKDKIKQVYENVLAKFGDDKTEYTENGVTFKLITTDTKLSDGINGEDNMPAANDKKTDPSVSNGYYLTENVVYVVKDVTDLVVSQLRAIVLAPFTDIEIQGGESVGTVIGKNVTNTTTETHTGLLQSETGEVPDSAKFNIIKEIAKQLHAPAAAEGVGAATLDEVTESASFLNANETETITEAWKKSITTKKTVEQLSGETITHWFGTKSTPTPPVVPPTPPVVPPTPPVVPPTPPVTPPGTPDVPVTPGTPEVPGVPTTPTGVLGVRRGESKPAAAVLGARRGVLGEKRVLGARTEDTSNAAAAFGVILGSVALSGAWLTLRRKKKVQ